MITERTSSGKKKTEHKYRRNVDFLLIRKSQWGVNSEPVRMWVMGDIQWFTFNSPSNNKWIKFSSSSSAWGEKKKPIYLNEIVQLFSFYRISPHHALYSGSSHVQNCYRDIAINVFIHTHTRTQCGSQIIAAMLTAPPIIWCINIILSLCRRKNV